MEPARRRDRERRGRKTLEKRTALRARQAGAVAGQSWAQPDETGGDRGHLSGKGIRRRGGCELHITRDEWMMRTWKKILLTVQVPSQQPIKNHVCPWPSAQSQDILPFLTARVGREEARMTAAKSYM